MSQFLRNAEEILTAARHAEPCADADPLHILIAEGGAIQVIAGGGWSGEALMAHYAPKMMYRISRGRGTVRVEGRAAGENCVLEAARPPGLRLPPEQPRYVVEPCAPSGKILQLGAGSADKVP